MKTEGTDAIAEALTRAAQWLNGLADSGGPDLRGNAHLKVGHEGKEFADNPVLEEFADVAISLVGAALFSGFSTYQIAAAIQSKMAVNEKREWVQQPDGTWQHR